MGGGGSQTSTTSLPDWAQPYVEEGAQSAIGDYRAGRYGHVEGLAKPQEDAFGRQLELGRRDGVLDNLGRDSYGAAQAYRSAASGQGLFGADALGQQAEALESTIGDATKRQLGALNTGASLGGALGSARNQAATEAALAQTAGNIAQNELQQRRAASLQGAQGVIGSSGTIGDQYLKGAQTTEGVGQALQQQRQNESDAAYQATQRLFGLLGSGAVGQKQVTTGGGK